MKCMSISYCINIDDLELSYYRHYLTTDSVLLSPRKYFLISQIWLERISRE